MNMPLIITYESTKTEREIYQIILANTDEMITALGDDKEMLWKLIIELKNRLAHAENQHYKAKQKINDQEFESFLSKARLELYPETVKVSVS